MLFFMIPFPMLFEYGPMMADPDSELLKESSPTQAFSYLFIGFALWLILAIFYFRQFVKPLLVKGNIQRIKESGVLRRATILSKEIQKSKKEYDELALEITLKNLSGSTIKIPYIVSDKRPELNRFAPGKTLILRLDPNVKSPYLIPDEAVTGVNKAFLAPKIGIFISIILFAFGYLIFSYWLQSHGRGWRFLHLWHPWLTIPFFCLLFSGMFRYISAAYPGAGSLFGFSSSKHLPYIFKGKLTKAQVIKTEQTGTYINEQPQVRFRLKYTDEVGRSYTTTLKEIVSLLELSSVNKPYRMILYLPDTPTDAIFAEDYTAEPSTEPAFNLS